MCRASLRADSGDTKRTYSTTSLMALGPRLTRVAATSQVQPRLFAEWCRLLRMSSGKRVTDLSSGGVTPQRLYTTPRGHLRTVWTSNAQSPCGAYTGLPTYKYNQYLANSLHTSFATSYTRPKSLSTHTLALISRVT
jgi:hypothetical protein